MRAGARVRARYASDVLPHRSAHTAREEVCAFKSAAARSAFALAEEQLR